MKAQVLGKEGEMIAAAYLEAQGYQIQARNYRAGRGEIDLIAQHRELLIFVEVKTRSTCSHGFPEEAVSAEKAKMIAQTADTYIEEKNWQGDIRFDILSIELSAPCSISHFEDAFAP